MGLRQLVDQRPLGKTGAMGAPSPDQLRGQRKVGRRQPVERVQPPLLRRVIGGETPEVCHVPGGAQAL